MSDCPSSQLSFWGLEASSAPFVQGRSHRGTVILKARTGGKRSSPGFGIGRLAGVPTRYFMATVPQDKRVSQGLCCGSPGTSDAWCWGHSKVSRGVAFLSLPSPAPRPPAQPAPLPSHLLESCLWLDHHSPNLGMGDKPAGHPLCCPAAPGCLGSGSSPESLLHPWGSRGLRTLINAPHGRLQECNTSRTSSSLGPRGAQTKCHSL